MLWLAVTVALFVVPIDGPRIKLYSVSHADGSGKEVFIALFGLLALISLTAGIVILAVAWIRGRRARSSREPVSSMQSEAS